MFDMLSPQVWAAYVGGLLTGLFALFGMLLSAGLERRRRTEAASREDLIWFRNAIAEAYSQALYYLFKLSISSSTATRSDKDVRQQLSESQRYLLLLYAYQPDTKQKQALLNEVAALDNLAGNLSVDATAAANTVRSQFQSDKRLNVLK